MEIADLSELAGLSEYASDSARTTQAIRETLKEIGELSIETLERNELGALSFSDIHDRIAEVLRISREAQGSRLIACPVFQLNLVEPQVKAMLQGLKTLAAFSLRDSNVGRAAEQIRSNLAREFVERATAYFGVLLPALSYTAAHEIASAREDRPTKVVAELEQMQRTAVRHLKELDAIREKGAAQGRQIAIEGNARFFSAQAKEHLLASRWWLGAASISAAGAATWAAFAYQQAVTLAHVPSASAPSGAMLVQLGIAKLLMLSVLVAVATWCARNYGAHRHNYVVNRHRENALSSFEMFVSSTDDPQVKNAVLVQATTSIFAPQNTAYGSADSDGTPVTQLIETIRTVAEPKK